MNRVVVVLYNIYRGGVRLQNNWLLVSLEQNKVIYGASSSASSSSSQLRIYREAWAGEMSELKSALPRCAVHVIGDQLDELQMERGRVRIVHANGKLREITIRGLEWVNFYSELWLWSGFIDGIRLQKYQSVHGSSNQERANLYIFPDRKFCLTQNFPSYQTNYCDPYYYNDIFKKVHYHLEL